MGAALIYTLARPREPAYDGRRLSQWLVAYAQAFGVESEMDAAPSSPEGKRAAEAIRHLGVASLPYLLEWIQYERPPWRTRLLGVLGRFPDWLKRDQLLSLVRRDELLAVGAIRAYHALGSEASPAAADLGRLITHPKMPDLAGRAMLALAGLGEAGVPLLLSTLTNHQEAVPAYAVYVIRYLGTNARPALPLLVQCLKDKNPETARLAAETLGCLKLESELMVPPLTETLRDPRADLRKAAATALMKFNGEARSAVPALIRCLKDDDEIVIRHALEALGVLRLEPTLVVPALITSLQDSNFTIRLGAATALGGFGAQARPAVPALVKALTDPDLMVQTEATNALLKIDPQALTDAAKH